MERQLDFSKLAPKAPGYILAPTKFVLKGEPADFIDWEEADHWADDPSYWLLVFRACPEKDGKWVQLTDEIRVNEQQRLHSVPLAKHWGKDVRPALPQASDTLLHAWGWRYPDSNKNPYDLYVHWVLASPFQLAWSSLPSLDAKDRTCNWTTFEKWADKRGIEHTFLTSEELARSPVVVSVASTWQEGFALNRALVQAIDRSLPTPQQRKERFLHDLVNMALHQNPQVLPHLKKAELDAFGERIQTQERETNDRLTRESVRFDSFLKGKRYAALQRDTTASKDPTAPNQLLAFLGRVYRRVVEAPPLAPRLKEHAAEITEHLKLHYDEKAGFKDFRKAAKSYWYLVKTFIAAAEIKSGVPEWLRQPCRDFAQKWYGINLRLALVPNSASKAQIFEPKDVKAAKTRSTESMAHLRFFALLEVVNVGTAIWDFAEAKPGTDTFRKGASLIGSVSSLASGAIEIAKVMDKNMAKRGGKVLSIVGGQGTKALGMVSSSMDIIIGVWSVAADVQNQEGQLVKFHGAQALGGAISVVGYFMMATGVGAPVGALFVFLGSALGLGGSLGATFSKSSDLENWFKFCKWGVLAGKEGVGGDDPKSWAEGLPRELCLQANRQIRTLSALLIDLQIDLSMVYDPNHPEVEVVVHANMIASDGSIHLELTIEGVRMRKLSLWKHGTDRGPDGLFRERFSLGDAANVTVRVRIDPFGDGQLWHPQEPVKKSATLVPPKGTLGNPFIVRPY